MEACASLTAIAQSENCKRRLLVDFEEEGVVVFCRRSGIGKHLNRKLR